MSAADFITSVSEYQNAAMAARYPWLDATRMAAIPIGADPDDYTALGNLSVTPHQFGTEQNVVNLTYVGTIWPPVLDTLRILFRAAARLRKQAPNTYRQLRLNFVGTSANPNDTTGFKVRGLAETEGVADIVREVPQRLPYLQALSIQATSDAILVLGSQEPHYTASKIFGVLMSGRPYLSVFHRSSSAHGLLMKADSGISLAFASAEELAALEQPIADAMSRLMTSLDSFARADPAVYAPFGARAIAARYGAIFDQLVNEKVHVP